ncbi:OmpA family protein [Flavobacterium sp.]|uniref:OmpA family protein n=1 Tax=Flavobacterium sp. TaxID=239 RepID=UPI00260D7FCB|nr:OmpA family protein [Flavobacterium sp.]
MKQFKILLFILFASIIYKTNAQVTTPVASTVNNSGFQFSLRGGYDLIPMYDNNTPYIDYKGGLELGASADYYWNWFGLGADFDYIKNSPKNTYPTTNLFFGGAPISGLNFSKDNITRTFYGIGPSFKYQRSNRFSTELKFRAGLGNIKGGKLQLDGTTSTLLPILLNYHAGYDAKNVLSGKASLQFNYFFNTTFGIHAGAYYLRHFGVDELVDTSTGYSSAYAPFTTTSTLNETPKNNITTLTPANRESCNCDISSIGVYAGITIKLSPGVKEKKICSECIQCTVCGKTHMPPMCACQTCGCKVSITARDKYTKEILPDTDIVLVNSSGQTTNTGKTNGFGVVVFDNVKADNYTIKGVLNSVNLIDGTLTIQELSNCQANGGVISKEILYGDRNFIIKGRAFECNSTTPIAGINVTLENKDLAVKKSTMTDSQGNFLLQLPETGTYELYGRKENYFSQIERVTGGDYNRDKNLFVKLEMCAEKVDCGKGLNLKNILFDLDKYVIKEVAKPELNRLVRFMLDNPTVKVEVGSHTDCRDTHKYNATLSQNRANASVDYVVSQGIDRSRISGVGYGETRLLNRCADGVNCSEAEHSINRRTEMKVICPN